jgi:hypothetical protein
LLQQTLEEEKRTDQKLTELSEEINSEALGDAAEAEDEGPRSMHKTFKAGSSR